MVDYLGLVPVFLIFLALWGLTDVWRSGRAMGTRLFWTGILAVPGLGFLAWFLAGPRAA